METDRLRYFCVIAETGSLTAAAGILNISHSGLSKAMTVLQSELNQQLFRPLGRGLELTEAGKAVYQRSKPVLESIERLKQPMKAPEAARLRIGLAEILTLHIAGEIAEVLSQGVDFYDTDSGEAETKVLESGLDFAVTFLPFPHPDLEYLKIKKIQMGVFYRNPRFKNVSLADLPFVAPNVEIRNNPLSLRSRDGWPSELPRQCVYGASTLAAALKVVEAGRAAVFMPKFLGGGLLEYETKKNLFSECDRDVFVVKKKNADESKAMKSVARLIRHRC